MEDEVADRSSIVDSRFCAALSTSNDLHKLDTLLYDNFCLEPETYYSFLEVCWIGPLLLFLAFIGKFFMASDILPNFSLSYFYLNELYSYS